MKKFILAIIMITMMFPTTVVMASTDNNHNIKLTLGETKVLVNGEEKSIDVAPFAVNGRTLVPLRFISETLGYEVYWINDKQEVSIRKNDGNILDQRAKTLFLQINNHNVRIYNSRISVNPIISIPEQFKTIIGKNKNKEEVYLDQPPITVNGRTMVPIRFISEQMGLTVNWDNETKSITITE